MKKDISIGSMFIGAITFALIGYILTFIIINYLGSDFKVDKNVILFILLGLGVIIGLTLGYKVPVFTEIFSFGITMLLLSETLWDLFAKDWSRQRVIILLSTIIIIIINLFSGKLRIKTAKKVFKRQIGVS